MGDRESGAVGLDDARAMRAYLHEVCATLPRRQAVPTWREWRRTAVSLSLPLLFIQCGGVTKDDGPRAEDGPSASDAGLRDTGSPPPRIVPPATGGAPASVHPAHATGGQAASGAECTGSECDELCTDLTDNDGDGLADCDDPDCLDD